VCADDAGWTQNQIEVIHWDTVVTDIRDVRYYPQFKDDTKEEKYMLTRREPQQIRCILKQLPQTAMSKNAKDKPVHRDIRSGCLRLHGTKTSVTGATVLG
jgi:hypothetical protein